MGEADEMMQGRNSQLDIAKGLGMTIVVLFHAQILSGVWTQFHMPLFAFLSGLLYREKYNTELNQVWNYTKKKIKGCYVPFLIYNFAFLILHNLFYKIHIYGELSNQKYYNGTDFVHQIIAITTMGGGESLPGPMWYLIAMLEFTVLYVCIRFGINKSFTNENKMNVCVTIVCVCLMLLGFSTIDLPRMLNRALVLLFWYHLGYMTHTYLEPQKGNIENKKETVITAALSIGILIIGIRGGADWPRFSWIILPAGCAGIILTLDMAQLVDKYTSKLKRCFVYIGQHTMFVLGTQYLGFKVGNMLQIIFQGRNINWLEMYGVTEEENFGWKAIYFLCGILIPLTIIKGKDALTRRMKMRKYDDKEQSKNI